MDPNREYIDYVLAFSLSMFAGSAAYFFNPAQLTTYVTLLTIPLLFGYTAYISKNGFRKSSALSLSVLFFAMINPTTAAITVFIALANPLISAFAGGEHFHDYFHAISVPLLISGILIGTIGFYAVSSQPDLQNQLINGTADFVGEKTESFTESSGLINNMEDSQIEMIESTSEASVAMTYQHVQNETFDELDPDERRAVSAAFQSAQEEVPAKITDEARKGAETQEVDISEQVSGSIKNVLGQQALIAIIPITAFLLYSLQPLIGFLTALVATVFSTLDSKYGIFGAY